MVMEFLKTMDTVRYFANKFADYDGVTPLLSPDGSLEENCKKLIQTTFERLFDHWQKQLYTTDPADTTVYTGTAGCVILYMKVYESKILPDPEKYLTKAYNLVQASLKYIDKVKIPSFMCGEVGILTTAALVYHLKKMDYEEFVKRILVFQTTVLNTELDSERMPDELLYGRAGYLFALMLLRSKIPETSALISNELIRNIVSAILTSGVKTSNKAKAAIPPPPFMPLVYFWSTEPYVGAAHGYAGIVHLLLEAKEYLTPDEIETLIKPTIDHVISWQFPSGNFPVCIGDVRDELVHWCHGSPGVIHMLVMAQTKLGNDRYLESAVKAADNIWEKGILKRGYGLCHGIAGNAYAFLRMYSLTKEPKYLYRAMKFAEFACDYGTHQCRTPDTPFSLFEGLAGTLYFFIDLIRPNEAKFPAFQL